MPKVYLGSKSNRRLKEELLTKFETLGVYMTDEADFFLGLITARAERMVEARYKKLPGAFRLSRARKQNSVYQKTLNGRLDLSLEKFVRIAVSNSRNGSLTASGLYLTMKSICPLWPFC